MGRFGIGCFGVEKQLNQQTKLWRSRSVNGFIIQVEGKKAVVVTGDGHCAPGGGGLYEREQCYFMF